jgi:N-acetyl-gamma-glutamyl-phosphate reductase
MTLPINAVVLGATGYVGGELLRLIAGHPRMKLAAAVSTSCEGQPVATTFPHLASACDGVSFRGHDDWPGKLEHGAKVALFSAAPHGASARTIASALDTAAGMDVEIHVVDSSADFRYTKQTDFEDVYQVEHGAPALLDQFQCSVPELASKIDTPHVGHPGCFATAISLAAVPLLQSGIAKPELFVAATTGSTGSGRSPQAGTHHPERHSNQYAYKPLAHRHTPEITSMCNAVSDSPCTINFVPHSGPFARGIYATVQAKTRGDVSLQQLRDAYTNAYGHAPFVVLVDGTPRLKNVVASNFCHIGVAVENDTVVVMSALDNLVKGAAGGAMQWMNRLWQLPETSGLLAPAPGWT